VNVGVSEGVIWGERGKWEMCGRKCASVEGCVIVGCGSVRGCVSMQLSENVMVG
jgi:hypothetical protein